MGPFGGEIPTRGRPHLGTDYHWVESLSVLINLITYMSIDQVSKAGQQTSHAIDSEQRRPATGTRPLGKANLVPHWRSR